MNGQGFAAIILAAGASSRMRRDKALLPWNGQTFLGGAIDRLRPFAQVVIVVAGANAHALRDEVQSRRALLVVNEQPERGQFSSLRMGLEEALNRQCEAAIIALVDRPPAAASTIHNLIQHFNSRSGDVGKTNTWAIVPEYSGKHGHPIVIGREMIDCLLKADPDSTARDVEHANQDRIKYVLVDDPNVIANVNTPEEYERLKRDPQID